MSSPHVAVIGLGYVGLPLALALARHYTVSAFDISETRVAALQDGVDVTGEISASELAASNLVCSNDATTITGADYFIITVPTPVDAENRPDLNHVLSACQTVGRAMKKGAIVVLESTVYPGVTEDVCGPELEAASNLKSGQDFFLGYSPERINPGDREHTIDKITKVVSGQTPDVAKALSDLYGAITAGGVFVAKSIKTAE
ncbi:MAG: nucleotide sugar dehydrogenase, partial [Alphaproteobacteria bacterium]|nr:nucleotide sugar dehydrogenase [Alphaproteobacteria bacterium]